MILSGPFVRFTVSNVQFVRTSYADGEAVMSFGDSSLLH